MCTTAFVCSYVSCILKIVSTLDCVQAVGCFVGLIPGDFLFTKFYHCIYSMPLQLMHNIFAFIIRVSKK